MNYVQLFIITINFVKFQGCRSFRKLRGIVSRITETARRGPTIMEIRIL